MFGFVNIMPHIHIKTHHQCALAVHLQAVWHVFGCCGAVPAGLVCHITEHYSPLVTTGGSGGDSWDSNERQLLLYTSSHATATTSAAGIKMHAKGITLLKLVSYSVSESIHGIFPSLPYVYPLH
jgi:hypothetical protein